MRNRGHLKVLSDTKYGSDTKLVLNEHECPPYTVIQVAESRLEIGFDI